MIDSPLNRFRQDTIIKIEMNRDKDKEKTIIKINFSNNYYENVII